MVEAGSELRWSATRAGALNLCLSISFGKSGLLLPSLLEVEPSLHSHSLLGLELGGSCSGFSWAGIPYEQSSLCRGRACVAQGSPSQQHLEHQAPHAAVDAAVCPLLGKALYGS